MGIEDTTKENVKLLKDKYRGIRGKIDQVITIAPNSDRYFILNSQSPSIEMWSEEIGFNYDPQTGRIINIGEEKSRDYASGRITFNRTPNGVHLSCPVYDNRTSPESREMLKMTFAEYNRTINETPLPNENPIQSKPWYRRILGL